jgi:hypothetical protein
MGFCEHANGCPGKTADGVPRCVASVLAYGHARAVADGFGRSLQPRRKAASGGFSFIEFPGDHTYLADRAQDVFSLIEAKFGDS